MSVILPDDIMKEIMLYMNYNQIIKLKCVNRYIGSLMDKNFWIKKYHFPFHHDHMVYNYTEYVSINKIIEKVDKWLMIKCHIRFDIQLNIENLIYLINEPLTNLDLTYFSDHTIFVNPLKSTIRLTAPNIFYPIAGLILINVDVDHQLLLIKLLYLYPSDFIIDYNI